MHICLSEYQTTEANVRPGCLLQLQVMLCCNCNSDPEIFHIEIEAKSNVQQPKKTEKSCYFGVLWW